MHCHTLLCRQLRRLSALPALLLTLPALLLIPPAPAYADQVEQHGTLVQKYITEQHANPLVADCAAHAGFVVSTSSYYDRAEFPDNTLDDQHAKIEPWNESFDNGKQRIKVDTMVTVVGQGIRKDGSGSPDPLTFKCGYVDDKMLAFSYNDPVPPAVSHSSGASHGKAGRNSRHGKKGHASTHSRAHAGSRSGAKSSARSTAKSGASKKPAAKGKKTAAKKKAG